MATVMLFLQQTTGKTERHTHFCMPLEPVFTRDCGSGVHFTDEPTGALDSKAGKDLLECLKNINESRNTAILMVTHDPFCASYAKDVYILSDGMIKCKISAGYSRKEFYDRIIEIQTSMGGDFS